MSFMDFFRSAPTEGSQQQPQQVQQPQQPQQQPQDPKTPEVIPGSSGEPTNPMVEFEKLFEKGKVNEVQPVPSFHIPQDKLAEHASKQNFMSGVPQELVQQATNGDVSALMKLMNHVGQNAYQASLAHQSQLTDTYVKTHSQHTLGTAVNEAVTSTLTQQAFSKVPNYKNPVVREQLNETAEKIRRANPEASPEEVANMAVNYLNKLHSALNPQTQEEQQPGKGEMDWDKYFGATE